MAWKNRTLCLHCSSCHAELQYHLPGFIFNCKNEDLNHDDLCFMLVASSSVLGM